MRLWMKKIKLNLKMLSAAAQEQNMIYISQYSDFL